VLVAAIVLLIAVEALLVLYVDRGVGLWALSVYQTDAADYLGGAGVPLGGPLPYLAAILLALWAARRYRWAMGRRVAFALPLVFALSGLGSYAVKAAVGRPRPFMLEQPPPTFNSTWERRLDRRYHSFPSSDVMVAAGLATVLFLMLERGRARYAVFAIPVYSAFGRIIIARHYPSDCLAAVMLGIAATWLLWRLQERLSAAARAARTGGPEPSPEGPGPPAPPPFGEAR